MAKVFWDTNLFIYLFEDHPVYAARVADLRRKMLARGDFLYTSALSVGEILVKPTELDETELARRYLGFFSGPGIQVISFDLNSASLYAQIRHDRGIRRPDAMQLACAASAGIDLFLTNDERLSRKVVAGIDFICSLDRSPL